MANKSRRSFTISVLACVAFVAAAVISWDLPVKHVVYYLAFILVVLFVIILVAMGFGALLSWLRRRK